MLEILPFFILVPLAGFLAGLSVPRKKEALQSGIAIGVLGLQLIGILCFIAWWWMNNSPALDVKQAVLYKGPKFEFFIDFYFDRITAVFASAGAGLTLLVAIFSRYYMHREAGFKRFFTTLLLFFTGYNLVIFSGNFETLFIGWEFLGITSFLLIAFYRDRYLPVKNGFKVLSFYRFGDICLILAMWMSHHLWHKNITFAEWEHIGTIQAQYQLHYPLAMFISVMIVLAAMIKSAQFPFSGWLPRAMEGPTTSSAIFYGSLSVHIGVFLLLRTYPFWGQEFFIKGLIIAVGVSTALIATGIAKVQSSVKTQIAYSSIAQIGLIFIEIALGFHGLALVHFAGNALLRTYQLLVSPSVLSYMVHDMFFNFTPRRADKGNVVFNRIRNAVYILNIKEWNVDFILHRYLWNPFKWIGNKLSFINGQRSFILWMLILPAGAASLSFKERIETHHHEFLSTCFSAFALLMVLKAFTERGDARRAWLLAFFSQFFTALSILWNKHIEWHQVGFYLSGTVTAAIAGYVCLYKIKSIEGDIELNRYHGHVYERPGIALAFLVSALALSGFPITPTFIGIDLIFTHIHANQIFLALVMALNFLFLELSMLRIYTRIFLGQHKKAYHPIAFKSS